MRRSLGLTTVLAFTFLIGTCLPTMAKEWKSGIPWKEPKVVTPGADPSQAPSDAIILFDGKDLSKWENGENWTVKDGIAVVGKGDIHTKQSFGDCQLHIEWASPNNKVKYPGNSGVFMMDRYEIQILESYANKIYVDGQAGAIYKQSPPLVNVCRKPDEWQTFDIIFHAPRFSKDGKLTKKATVTVLQNGVLILDNFAIEGATAWDEPPKYTAHPKKLPIRLQDHNCPVRFRNIWIRELTPRPKPAVPAKTPPTENKQPTAKQETANYSMWGTHDQKSPIYKPGQPMVFTIKLLKDGKPTDDATLEWKRTGDDGITEEGSCPASKEGAKITVSTKEPGFVRLYVVARDKDGKKFPLKNNRYCKFVLFDGGACVAPETLQSVPEPDDFDAFWKKQKELLAATPMKVLEMKEVEGTDQVKAYDMKIACAGGMPVSGYLTMPKNAKPKSLAAEVSFRGYGVKGASKDLHGGKTKICFQINAHGIENGKPDEYYTNLKNTTLRGYAFSVEENSDPNTTYFRGMFLRVMRALEFVKSLPEWDGKNLQASGGSQGGLQSLVAASLDPDVTSCYAWSPWCCDFGRTELNRITCPWYVKYTPALRYFDPVNLVKRANPKCKLSIVANLGDYTCPPSGVWIVYNNFPGPKKLEVRQGCEHGFTMKDYPKFVIESK